LKKKEQKRKTEKERKDEEKKRKINPGNLECRV
jgi:hypothetical protein